METMPFFRFGQMFVTKMVIIYAKYPNSGIQRMRFHTAPIKYFRFMRTNALRCMRTADSNSLHAENVAVCVLIKSEAKWLERLNEMNEKKKNKYRSTRNDLI